MSGLAEHFNLVCENGHRWFSPEPMAFVDKECGIKGFRLKKLSDGTFERKTHTCKKKLKVLRGSRKVNPPKPKHPMRKKLKKMKRY